MFRSDDSLAIADFGISKRIDETGEITRHGSVLGTPNYLSPEQALGKTVDRRSDLYSTGIMLFEMLTGQKPFKAETAPGIVFQHVHADIPLLPPHVRNYQPLLEMLLAKDPDGRFSSSEEFLDSGFLLLQESRNVVSPISVLYYEYYDETGLDKRLQECTENLQCIVGNHMLCDVDFGNSQLPEVWDYPDKVDTLKFLQALN
jgi:serine/threonine protein kinase